MGLSRGRRATGVAICLVGSGTAADVRALTVTPSGSAVVVDGTTGGDSIGAACVSTLLNIVDGVTNVPTTIPCASATAVTVNAGDGNDTVNLNALSSAATFPALGGTSIDGGIGLDTLIGTARPDTIDGGANGDVITASGGADSLTGNTGTDQLNAALTSSGTISLTGGSLGFGGVAASASSFESASLTGSNGADTLDASLFGNGPVTLKAGNADDLYAVATTDSTIVDTAGSDTLTGFVTAGLTTVTDTTVNRPVGDIALTNVDEIQLRGGSNTVPVTVNAAAATIPVSVSGGFAADSLTGSGTAPSTLIGGDGNDTLVGGSGADVLTSGQDVDSVNGAGGFDTLSETALTNVALSATAFAGASTTATLASVEAAELTAAASGLNGDAQQFPGPVTVNGGAGNDRFTGGQSSDVFHGGGGTNTFGVVAGPSFAELVSDSLTVVDGAVADTLDAVASVRLIARNTGSTLVVDPGVTVPVSLEGRGAGDTLQAAGGAVTLAGGEGNDLLKLAGPVPTVIGGLGTDTVAVDAVTTPTVQLAPAALTLGGVATPLSGVEAGRSSPPSRAASSSTRRPSPAACR